MFSNDEADGAANKPETDKDQSQTPKPVIAGPSQQADNNALVTRRELDKEIEDIHRKIQGQIPKPNIGPKKVPGGGTSSPKPPSDAHVDLKPFEKPASHEDHDDQNELATGPGMVTNTLSFCLLFHGAIKHWFVRKAN